MGLLDMFDNGDAQLGLGLLGAAAPRADGAGFGQRLMEGVGSAQAMRTAQMQRNMQQLQFQSAMRTNDLINKAIAENGDQGTAAQGPSQPQQFARDNGASMGGALGSGTFGLDSVPGQSLSPNPMGSNNIPATPIAASQPQQSNTPGGHIPWSQNKINTYSMIPQLAKAAELEQARQLAGQTDIGKLLDQAGITDPTLRSQITQQAISKATNIPLVAGRAGAPMYRSDGTIVAMAPKIPDNAVPQIVDGKVVGVSPLTGAQNIEQMNAYAGAAGKNQAEPIAGVDLSTGLPAYSNKLSAAQGGDVPGSGLDLSKMSADQAAALARSDPKAFSAGVKRFQSSGGVNFAPANPAGYADSQSKLTGANADRYNTLVNSASDSPVRVGVYDNILKLSNDGIATGPGQAFKNQLKGYVANTPLLGNVANSWKDDVTGAQELNKFMYQNAQRNWQAAGGTGTDAQLESYSKANPNDTMFPKALQAMAQWGKAGELALQGKTNAAQAWKDQNGGNVANYDQFEKQWRNNFDPMIYQLKTMPPDQASKTVADLQKNDPKAYANLMMKATALKNIGGL